MRLTRLDDRRHQARERVTSRPLRPSPGFAFLMLTSGCWTGGLHFAPLFWPDRKPPSDGDVD